MKRILSMVSGLILTVLIAGGGFTPSLRAQNEPGEIFTVPFAFTADGHEIGPGTYEVRRDSSQFLVSIRNVETADEQSFNVRPEQHRTIPSKGILVFHQCGDRKALTEFHVRGSKFYSATISARHKTDSEVGNCSPADTTTVAAR
jgi:hypothetical protein